VVGTDNGISAVIKETVGEVIGKPATDSASSLDAPLLFLPAFFASISMIIVSELGDKTFFIAAIMAMRHNRWVIFLSAICALGLMTVLSAVMGLALPSIMPREYTHLASVMLFVFFGIRLLRDAYYMSADEANEELEEVESELEKKEIELGNTDVNNLESGNSAGLKTNAFSKDDPSQKDKFSKMWQNLVSPIFIQCFTMTFLAEWGDRSQITTIALAAAKNPYGVTIGGVIGHALCTGLAVIGGKLLATRISEKTVATVGGVLFLFFALHGVLTGE